MAKGFRDGVVLGQLRTLFDEGAVASLSDGELLERFLADRGESGEAAFGALVHRHGPLVFGVCRRTLRDTHQTEDAFQATFLVLAKRARSIRNREAVGPWLLGVACKIARRARCDVLRRQAYEGKAAGLAPRWSSVEPSDRDEITDLLTEVDHLRRPLREVVVLCHFQGHSYASAADALGISEGTVRGRLARARDVLRARLPRRGGVCDNSASVPLASFLPEAAPALLVNSTIRGAMAIAVGRAATGIVPGSAITLMEGALKAMLSAKLKTSALIVLGVGLITFGAAVRGHAWARPEPVQTGEARNDAASDLASLVGGKIVRSSDVTKDCMVLAYMPDWNFGNVDNIGIASNGGGVRTFVDWPDVPASEAKSPDLKFYLAFYSRATTLRPKPGTILAFEVVDDWSGRTKPAEKTWPERTSWNSRPYCDEDPVATYKFETGEGWKLFDITAFVRERAGKSGKGLMFRCFHEDRRDEWSGYQFVSREGSGE